MAPLTKQERQCLKRIMARYPKMPREEALRRARRMAKAKEDALKGYPTQTPEAQAPAPDPKAVIIGSMSLPEKAALGAGLWGLKRWWRREVMPELVSQPSLAPTRKVAGAFEGGAVATIIIAAAGYFGVEIPPGVAAAIVTLVAFGYAWLRREKTSKEG